MSDRKIANILLSISYSLCFGGSKVSPHLNTHNVCFSWEKRKLFYAFSSRALYITPGTAGVTLSRT